MYSAQKKENWGEKSAARMGDYKKLTVNECNGDLSPTIAVFDSAPIGVGPISQLHSLIAVEGHAEPSIIVLGEFEPEGLDSFAV